MWLTDHLGLCVWAMRVERFPRAHTYVRGLSLARAQGRAVMAVEALTRVRACPRVGMARGCLCVGYRAGEGRGHLSKD